MATRRSRMPSLFRPNSQPAYADDGRRTESAQALPLRRLRRLEGGRLAGGDLHMRLQGEGANESGAQVRAQHGEVAGISGRNYSEASVVGIRDFSNQPCVPCAKDTVHFAMKCRECGHVNETSYAACRRSVNRHFGLKKRGRAEVASLANARLGLAAERRAANNSDKLSYGVKPCRDTLFRKVGRTKA
jgi:hypothetical protein